MWRNIQFHAVNSADTLSSDFSAGQFSNSGAATVSTLVCDCQSHRQLLSARQRAFHPLLLPEAPSSGETKTPQKGLCLCN